MRFLKAQDPGGPCRGHRVEGGLCAGAGLGGDLEAPPPDRVLTGRGVCPQDPLLRVQEALNGTEVHLQHLTALVDCRSLHLVSAGRGRSGRAARVGSLEASSWGRGQSSMSVSPASRLRSLGLRLSCGLRTTCRR